MTGQLLPQHRAKLETDSAINPEVAAERGYLSVTATDPHLAPFGDYQRATGILIPVRPPDGSNGRYQLRRDVDRKRRDGSTAKYEMPEGQTHRLDVHPRNHRWLGDRRVTLWVTEGIKKGDALTSAGRCAVALGGVWCFRKECLADWELIELQGRVVMIVFDSDAETNEHVAAARDALAAFLTERGAIVKILRVPHGPNGEKLGVDDYLALGADLVELVAQHAELWRPSTSGECQRPDCQDLVERTKAETGILTNPKLRLNRRVPYLLWLRRYWSDLTRQRTESDAGPTPVVDPDGWDTVRLQAWGQEIGLSAATLAKAADELASLGQLEVDRVTERLPDGRHRSDFRVRPLASSSYLEMVRSLATVVQAPSHWGGARQAGCPVHPDAVLVARTERQCTECWELVGEPTVRQIKPTTGLQVEARSLDQEPASIGGRRPANAAYRRELAGAAAAARTHQEQDGRIRATGLQLEAPRYGEGASEPRTVTGLQLEARSEVEPTWLFENVDAPPPRRCITSGCENAPPHRHAARCDACLAQWKGVIHPAGVAS